MPKQSQVCRPPLKKPPPGPNLSKEKHPLTQNQKKRSRLEERLRKR
jgi:hypothetical protein